jgi:hypothetical protein
MTGMLLGMAPAQAGTLTVTVRCEALGASRFACTATTVGGVAPYSYSWNVSSATTGSISGGCQPGVRVNATATATDAVGATGSGSGSVLCLGGPPR